MTQALPKLTTFDEFVAWYPENSPRRYELHDGVIVEMAPPTGDHEEIVGFLVGEIVAQYKPLRLDYFIPKTAFVKPPENDSAYSPDMLLLNRANLINEPRWKKESTVIQPASVPLVIEVVSTNWRDDYLKKYADYEEMGIPEYWIVDYAAFGGREFIGKPKQPTISICSLEEGEYVVHKFRGDDRIISPTFTELNLTAQQIFQAGVTSTEI
jgi:Uma2 family endonuclease